MAETGFRRLVLTLSPGADKRPTEFAILFAHRVAARLIVNIVQDKTVVGPASLPFVHEIDPQLGAWRALDPDALLHDFASDAASLTSRLQQQLHGAGVAADIRPPLAGAVQHETGDLYVLVEPADPLSRIANRFAAERANLLSGSRDVLFLPSETAPREGPVMALAASAEDRSIAAAAFLAERLSRGLSIRRIASDGTGRAHLSSALAVEPAAESLIVMTRGSFGLPPAYAIEIAASRQTPLLLLEPSDDVDLVSSARVSAESKHPH